MEDNRIRQVESILYVEDLIDTHSDFIAILQDYCKQLFIATNGQEGLDIYFEHKPSIVITDIQMPKIDGLEMIQIIKNNNEDQNILLISGYNHIEYLHKAIDLEVDGIFIKPINLDHFLKKLNKIIDTIYLKESLEKKELELKNQLEENRTITFNLYQKQEELVNQSKFAAMGEMISMIAHQWRQPLNSIGMNVNSIQMMVEKKKVKVSEFNQMITSINNSINYMSQTIDDFKDFLKKENKTHEVTLQDLVLKPKLLTDTEFKKYKIDFQFETNVNINDKVRIENSKFYQVMINMYKNAIDEFKFKKNIEKPFIRVTILRHENDFYEVKVKDNAGGVPLNIINRIFEPYFSTKSKNGTGLGLYMSKKIVQDFFNGDISVVNDNEGAVFSITFQDKSRSNGLANIDTTCYQWNQEKSIFESDPSATNTNILKQSKLIMNELDKMYIKYEMDKYLNIHLIME
ncbi:MAG: hybrid sensor histidine kinase/response regulator [Campylobacterales bacterium]|nr:hybrid sensor histidine kinase/response regulator [Campylobacterales bacterium]